MAVPDALLLLARGRAHARIHVEHDATRRPSAMHKVDPLARQVGKSSEVLGRREPLRLKAAHLARRGRAPAPSRVAVPAPWCATWNASGCAAPMRAILRPARTPWRSTVRRRSGGHHNPPYTRPLMHALIWHFARILPTWLLLETDWASTQQAAPFMPSCSDIVSVG